MATDLVLHHAQYTTDGTTGVKTIATGLSNAKGAILRANYGAHGSQHSFASMSFVLLDTSGAFGAYFMAWSTIERMGHRETVDPWNLIVMDNAGDKVIEGNVTLSATDLTVDLNMSESGVLIDALIFTGAGVDAELWTGDADEQSATFASDINLMFALHAVGGVDRTADARLQFGAAVKNGSITQYGLDVDIENSNVELEAQMLPNMFSGEYYADVSAMGTTTTWGANASPAQSMAILGIKTGGAVSMHSHAKAATIASPSESLPDAGFSNVGAVVVFGGATASETYDFNFGAMSLGWCAEQDGSLQSYGFVLDGPPGIVGMAENGEIIRQYRDWGEDGVASIDGAKRNPTMTWSTITDDVFQFIVLYIEHQGATPTPNRARMLL